MKAVNLLPEKHRPRKATGGRSGSSFVVLGVLGAIVVAVLVYALTVNSINSAKSDIADAKADTARANAEAGQLGPYGDFAKVKTERVKAVKDLADSRVDWERLVRELARVLPDGVWIQSANASDSPANSQTGAAATAGSGSSSSSSSSSSTSTSTSSTASAATAGTTAAAGPQVQLTGCAPDQPTVAETLVRLRTVEGAEDVTLQHSARPADTTGSSSSGGGSSSGSAGSGAAAGSTDCGKTNGKPNYSFQISISLEAPAPGASTPGTVPASLGGGR